jgi:DNA-binding CsgD family transcriptional regulator
MNEPSPSGPLLSEELATAKELLTGKQFLAYRHRRGGHALNWIARRMGVSRARVVHLIASAEKRLGYASSVTPKQRTPYKSVARRKQDNESGWQAYVEELTAQLGPEEFHQLLDIIETSNSRQERDRRLGERLRAWEIERRNVQQGYLPAGAEHDDDWSRAVGEDEAECAAEMEATFGQNSVTGEVMRPEDLVEDDGQGYDRY